MYIDDIRLAKTTALLFSLISSQLVSLMGVNTANFTVMTMNLTTCLIFSNA